MNKKISVVWRLRQRMEVAKINSAKELHRRMLDVAPGTIKYAQLARMLDAPPVRLNLQTLAVLTHVLSCTVGDILDACIQDEPSDQ